MRSQNKKFLSLLVLGFAVLVAVRLEQTVRAALVYDDSSGSAEPADAPAPSDKEAARTQLRNDVVKTVEPASSAVVTSAPAAASPSVAPVAPAQVVVIPAPVVAADTAQPVIPVQTEVGTQSESEKASGSELLRRKRVREEIRNEDALQTRMEELRLRDEQRRGEKVLGSMPVDDSPTPADLKAGAVPAAGVVGLPPAVTTPIGPQGPQPQVQAPMSQGAPVPGQDHIMMQQSAPMVPAAQGSALSNEPMGPYGSTKSDLERFDEQEASFFISPKIGTGGYSDTKGYPVSSFVAWGADLGVTVGPNIGLTFGYSYTKFSAGIPNSNPYLYNYGYTNNFYGYGGANFNRPIDIKQNIFDLGLRLYLLDKKARFRPFLGGSMGFARSYINYSKEIRNYWASQGVPSLGNDFVLDQFLGGLQGGFDVVLTKAVSVNLTGRYYGVISSRLDSDYLSNQFYNDPYFSGYYYYNPYNFIYNDVDKQAVSNSIADSGVYQVTGGVTFSF